MDEKKVLNWKGLKALGIPYSRAHIWRLMAAGEFPKAFKLGIHRNSPPVWWLREVIEWLELHSKTGLGSELINFSALTIRS